MLTSQWAPRAYTVSFKLETDESILISKARAAIEKYKVDAVVANVLQTRRDVVYIVYPGEGDAQEIRRPPTSKMIDPTLVASLVGRHSAFAGDSAADADRRGRSAFAQRVSRHLAEYSTIRV